MLELIVIVVIVGIHVLVCISNSVIECRIVYEVKEMFSQFRKVIHTNSCVYYTK